MNVTIKGSRNVEHDTLFGDGWSKYDFFFLKKSYFVIGTSLLSFNCFCKGVQGNVLTDSNWNITFCSWAEEDMAVQPFERGNSAGKVGCLRNLRMQTYYKSFWFCKPNFMVTLAVKGIHLKSST